VENEDTAWENRLLWKMKTANPWREKDCN